jgi:hypothetical protein
LYIIGGVSSQFYVLGTLGQDKLLQGDAISNTQKTIPFYCFESNYFIKTEIQD